MPDQMKAVVYDQFGEADNLKINNVTIPEPKEGEVMVKVEAAGVNPVDVSVLKGHLKELIPYEFPIIPGWDMTGTIEKRGFAARRFNIGDEVFAYARRPVVQWGTFAEYIVIPESYLSLRPHNITPEEAGCIPLTGLTAYQSLFEAGNLQEDQTVLILGASGGVGSMAIQLAKAKGAHIFAVASEKNHSFMKELGADETIDYHDTHIWEAVKAIQKDRVDLIFDCAAGETLDQSIEALKSNGRLVSILSQGEGLDDDINFTYVFVEPNSSHLNHLREMAEAGKLKVPVSKTYSLEETANALEQISTGHTTGKIVITP